MGAVRTALILALTFLACEPELASAVRAGSGSSQSSDPDGKWAMVECGELEDDTFTYNVSLDKTGANGGDVSWRCDLSVETTYPNCNSCAFRPQQCLTVAVLASKKVGNDSPPSYIGKCVDECSSCGGKAWSCNGTCVADCALTDTKCVPPDASYNYTWHCPTTQACVQDCDAQCPDSPFPEQDYQRNDRYPWKENGQVLRGKDWGFTCMSNAAYKAALTSKCTAAASEFQQTLLEGHGFGSVLNLVLLILIKNYPYQSPVKKLLVAQGIQYTSIVTGGLQGGLIIVTRAQLMLASRRECTRKEGWSWPRTSGRFTHRLLITPMVLILVLVALALIIIQMVFNYQQLRKSGSTEASNAQKEVLQTVTSNSIFRVVVCPQEDREASKACARRMEEWDWLALYDRGQATRLIDESVVAASVNAMTYYYGNAWACLFQVLYITVVLSTPYTVVMRNSGTSSFIYALSNWGSTWETWPIIVSFVLIAVLTFVIIRISIQYFWELPVDLCAGETPETERGRRCQNWHDCMSTCETDSHHPGKCVTDGNIVDSDEMLKTQRRLKISVSTMRMADKFVRLRVQSYSRMATCWALAFAKPPLPENDPKIKNSIVSMFTFTY